MATISAVILKADQKQDKTWNVKFRVTNNQRSAYINTPHYVTKNQIDKKGKLKNDFIIEYLSEDLKHFRKKVSELGMSVKSMSAQEIKSYLVQKNESIDFIGFCRRHTERLKEEGKGPSAAPMAAVVNSLEDYFKSKSVPITEITSNMLFGYERFLKTERQITRKNQLGANITSTVGPMTGGGVVKYMSYIRLLFNEARKQYNNEDAGLIRIPHYPFKKYVIGKMPAAKKKNLSVKKILSIRDFEAVPGTRSEMARDLFMLSFYLCGMNAIDIYTLPPYTGDKRINYNRSKTKGRRKDDAFISIAVPPEAVPILEKYAGNLQGRYGDVSAFRKGIKAGLDLIGVPGLTFYHARHSFATLARNECRFSKDDVALSLNHKSGSDVTDTYIAPDWKIIDDVQAGVLALLYG